MEEFIFQEVDLSGKFTLLVDAIEVGDVHFRRRREDAISINHTYVKREFEGRGYGKKLVERVILYADENQLNLSTSCWFADKIIQAHSA